MENGLSQISSVHRPDPLPLFADYNALIPFMFGVSIVGTFVAFPEIDLWIQRLAYSPDTAFASKRSGFWGAIYRSVPWITCGVTFGALTLLAWGEFRCKYVWGISRKAVAYLFTTLIIGPGVVVNTIFKNNWGRARPSQITEFGGTAQFSPAFVRVSECESNCSFVSGHASMGFYLIAIAFLFKGRHRTYMIWTALVYGSVTGIGRIIQGGHFFSDIIFSGLFTVSIAALCYHYMLYKDYLNYIPGIRPKWQHLHMS